MLQSKLQQHTCLWNPDLKSALVRLDSAAFLSSCCRPWYFLCLCSVCLRYCASLCVKWRWLDWQAAPTSVTQPALFLLFFNFFGLLFLPPPCFNIVLIATFFARFYIIKTVLLKHRFKSLGKTFLPVQFCVCVCMIVCIESVRFRWI